MMSRATLFGKVCIFSGVFLLIESLKQEGLPSNFFQAVAALNFMWAYTEALKDG